MVKDINRKIVNICSHCTKPNSISHFLIDSISNRFFSQNWAKWWEVITGFNIREENQIHEFILFRISGGSDDVMFMNYCMLNAKHYIYLENKQTKDENKKCIFNVEFLGYLWHLKYILNIGKNICTKKSNS